MRCEGVVWMYTLYSPLYSLAGVYITKKIFTTDSYVLKISSFGLTKGHWSTLFRISSHCTCSCHLPGSPAISLSSNEIQSLLCSEFMLDTFYWSYILIISRLTSLGDPSCAWSILSNALTLLGISFVPVKELWLGNILVYYRSSAALFSQGKALKGWNIVIDVACRTVNWRSVWINTVTGVKNGVDEVNGDGPYVKNEELHSLVYYIAISHEERYE